MSTEYVAILRAELERQREFLSAEEEQVLLKPYTYENDNDLALDRVKRRQHNFVAILRNRFVRDGRPLEPWWDLLVDQEMTQGYRAMVGTMVVQVLDWSARTSDQKVMMGGFASKLLSVAAMFSGFMTTFTLAVGAWPPGIVMFLITVSFWIGSRVLGQKTAERTGEIVAEYKRIPEPETLVTEEQLQTGSNDHDAIVGQSYQ